MVGKTSLLNQFIDGKFDAHESPTIGACYQFHRRVHSGVPVDFQIWDTAGQEKYRSLVPIYYRSCAGAIAVYDLSAPASLLGAKHYIASFRDVAGFGAPVALVANKRDLVADAGAADDGRRVADEQHYEFAVTSAKTGDGVEALFDGFTGRLAAELAERRRPKALRAPEARAGCC
jgi:Ras-related protein Rab-5C